MAKISIHNLKSVVSLNFTIPSTGVHVLTGVNGSGKTTLLTCLQRIVDKHAFQKHFKTSNNNQFDNFQSASITYEHDGRSVTYTYGNTRWNPTPRRNSDVLVNLGFSRSILIGSSGERFYTQNEELTTAGIISSPSFIKDSLNEIFETTKFSDLRRKKLDGRGRGEGRWNYGFLLPAGTSGGYNLYYSEKNFSLGEILILNALYDLQHIANNSLVLIDEIEMALHPRVQVKFLQFLERIAEQKDLTVIISTHSSSLIKAASNLIYLERDFITGHVNVEYNCYPAIALQNVAVTEEVQPDVVFFVEDTYAQYLLEEILSYYFANIHQGSKPIYKILPVGGWKETVKLAEASIGYLIPRNTTVIAMLDQDVLPTIQAIETDNGRTARQQEELELYRRNITRIKFLPITPELGICDFLNDNPAQHRLPLQRLFNGVFDITQIIRDEANRGLNYPPNPRSTAKKRLSFYVDSIKTHTNRDVNYVIIKLMEYYANSYCHNNHPALQQTFNPIFP